MTEKKEDIDYANLLKQLKTWREVAMEKPLRIMICGLGGSGKSTLVNHLLQLDPGEKWAEEGLSGTRTTTVVRSYEKKIKHGINVLLFDTPGLDDIDPSLSNNDIVTMMKKETNEKVHLVFYCISLAGAARVQGGDKRALEAMQLFSDRLWENTVIVLTFANDLATKKNKEDYLTVIRTVTDDVKRVLKDNAHVSEKVTDNIPIVTAGYTEPKLPDIDKWIDHLFLKALEQVDPNVLPALLEIRIDWEKLLAAGLVSAICGVLGGAIAGPIGTTIASGFAAGAILGGTDGVGGVAVTMAKLANIVAYKYNTWKYGRRPSTPYQETKQECQNPTQTTH